MIKLLSFFFKQKTAYDLRISNLSSYVCSSDLLSLPGGQDAIIAAVAAANPNTIVVLATGNPVAMPWLDKVKAVVAAWYPGQEGAAAIADVLTGKVNPSGRLPITFPAATDTLPRPAIPSYGPPVNTQVTVRTNEGSAVGYRWHARTGIKAPFPIGTRVTKRGQGGE